MGQPNRTAHSQSLQIVVNGMTEVFISFVGVEHVKRTTFGKHVDGPFPEFIRKAANPFLTVYYPKLASSKRRVDKLNSQIQEAVASYSLRE